MYERVLTSEEYNRRFTSNVVISESGNPELKEEWDYEPEVPDEFVDEEELKKKATALIGVRPSEFVEFSIKIPDKKAQKQVPFSFKGRRYLKLPYDTPAKRTLFKCGRQVEKSTFLGNKSLAYAAINNAFNILYVSPTNQQTKVFSQDRLKEPMETSDVLRAWTTSKLSDNVFLKKFINRSQITLRYAYHNADRTRGIPADLILIDELQDVMTDNIPVIEECASHSPFKIFLYSGTPKSFDNAIEHYWSKFSTQNEWVVPCDRHGVPGDPSSWHWNVLGEDNIGLKGLVCDRCKEPIQAMRPEAQWSSLNAKVRRSPQDGGLGDKAYEGFRVPQLMVPWLDWDEILVKYKTYPRSQFYNEVLGESFDSGTRPLTRQDIIDNCIEGFFMTTEKLAEIKHKLGSSSPVFAGIDWGTGEGSYTVLSLGAYIDGFFTIFYIHRFEGQETEPQVQLDIIETLIKYWNVNLVGADYGGGFDRNDHLQRKLGRDRIVKYQYSQPGTKTKWHPELHRFLVHRTEVMNDIFSAIKRKNFIRFPDYQGFEAPFAKDMLNIFSEFNEQQRQIQYQKSPAATDDSFHSILLCVLASLLRIPRMDILNPMAKTGVTSED